jgi:hypothetical protein
MVEADEDEYPLMEAEEDKELEREVAQNRRTRKQLREENATLTDTVKALKQHIVSQAKVKQLADYERSRLRDQCRNFVRVLKQISSTVVDEEMISKTSFSQKSYDAAMKEHDTERDLLFKEDAELDSNKESSDVETSKEEAVATGLEEELSNSERADKSVDEPKRTPSPDKQGAEPSLKMQRGLPIEKTIEESNEQSDVTVAGRKTVFIKRLLVSHCTG